MTKVCWGILSTADIGLQKVIPAMQKGRYCQIAAIASRSEEMAAAAADRLNIPKAYGSYEALLNDPQIEAVYIPLPNHLHAAWSIKALEAGKHVLCEKPIGMNAVEAEQLLEAAARYPKQKIMEAFMYRLHPQWREAKKIVASGGIGELRTIQTFFSYYNIDGSDIRNIATVGGGGLMDIGCYCISLSRFLFDAEPVRVSGTRELSPDFGTDRIFSGMLDFETGTSNFTCSTQLSPYQRVNILGEGGRIEIMIPFNAPPDEPCVIIHQQNGKTSEIRFEICDQYTIQGDLFSQAVLEDAPPPTPLKDAWSNMVVLDALLKSVEQDAWIRT